MTFFPVVFDLNFSECLFKEYIHECSKDRETNGQSENKKNRKCVIFSSYRFFASPDILCYSFLGNLLFMYDFSHGWIYR